MKILMSVVGSLLWLSGLWFICQAQVTQHLDSLNPASRAEVRQVERRIDRLHEGMSAAEVFDTLGLARLKDRMSSWGKSMATDDKLTRQMIYQLREGCNLALVFESPVGKVEGKLRSAELIGEGWDKKKRGAKYPKSNIGLQRTANQRPSH